MRMLAVFGTVLCAYQVFFTLETRAQSYVCRVSENIRQVPANFNGNSVADRLIIAGAQSRIYLDDNRRPFAFPGVLQVGTNNLVGEFRNVEDENQKEDVFSVDGYSGKNMLYVSESDEISPRFSKFSISTKILNKHGDESHSELASIVTGDFLQGDGVKEILAWWCGDGHATLVDLNSPNGYKQYFEFIDYGCINNGNKFEVFDLDKDKIDDIIFYVNSGPEIRRAYCSNGDGTFVYCGDPANRCPS